MNRTTASLLELLPDRSRFFAAPALIVALIYLIPACTDSGDPVGPTGGVNQPPLLNPIGKQYVAINNQLDVTISASDVESTPTLAIMNKPASATFTDNMDGTATFSWIPAPSDSGIVVVTFSASDDSSASATQVVSIEIITYTYANYVGQIMQSSCAVAGGCHDAFRSSGFDARTYLGLIVGGLSGPGIVGGDTARSVIYQRLLGTVGSQMPLSGAKFTTINGRMDSIATWILARAPEN